jgi:hypothetical protein
MAVSNTDIDALPERTTAQRLKAVRFAIDAILFGGQSRSIAGRAIASGNLNDLRKMEKELVAEINAAAGDDGWVSIETDPIS